MTEERDEQTMTAAEPAAVRPLTAYDTVIAYLHSYSMNTDTKRAVYKQLQTEVADENLSYMKRRLGDYEKLEAGWDGYGDAIPVKKETIDFMRAFLKVCRPADVSEWRLFPNVNGTLTLEQDDAAISIASKEFSYYAENGDKYMESEHNACSVFALTDTIRKINSFMQE